ncbi:hypothetical protein UPYG_G00151750 [Umbra pygmaea]|uniref:Gamma-secretase subunit PEN-2 n=1 Tax=Umbra pygmaea TaxID=75934 RepID=A0ABD0WX40_UMBPY
MHIQSNFTDCRSLCNLTTFTNTKWTYQETNMNLERLPNDEKLSLCRKYYLGGFAFLPFLWLVNVVWFFKEAFFKPAYTEQLQIKTYVKRSGLGLLLWVAVLTTWITIFQHFRAEWGEVGDYLSFTIPLGIP